MKRAYLRALSPPAISRPLGWLADRQVPGPLLRAVIAAYVRFYRVDLSEVRDPLASFRTFNAFFTRRLREGARPVDGGAATVVSPSDSRVAACGAIPADGRIDQVKGRTYPVAELLGGEAEARAFARGVYATLYLSPSMYHRVHCPVDGRITRWRHLPGRLYPVNALAVDNVPGLFAVNERVAVHLETEAFGPLALVMVGATNVGRITLAFTDLVTNQGGPGATVVPPAPISIARGDELGAFNLGSTVVLLAADPALRLVPAAGAFIRMGEPLWRR